MYTFRARTAFRHIYTSVQDSLYMLEVHIIRNGMRKLVVVCGSDMKIEYGTPTIYLYNI